MIVKKISRIIYNPKCWCKSSHNTMVLSAVVLCPSGVASLQFKKGGPLYKSHQSIVDEILASAHQTYELTGVAGSGKSSLLSYILSHYQVKACKTFEAFCKVRKEYESLSTMKANCSFAVPHIITELDLIIIDECYMVSGQNLLLLDHLLRKQLRCHKPFGGKTILFCGDPCQLGAIRNDSITTLELFGSLDIKRFELKTIKRLRIQNDEFVSLLGDIRDMIKGLRKGLSMPSISYFNYVLGVTRQCRRILCCTNKSVDGYNQKRAAQQPTHYMYKKKYAYWDKCPVRMTFNKKGKAGYLWTNQQSGTLMSIGGGDTLTAKTVMTVELENETVIDVPLGSPPAVVCAYARTIHSVQGMTHDTKKYGPLCIDFTGWIPTISGCRLLYTALTRVDDPCKLYVRGLAGESILIDDVEWCSIHDKPEEI
jgi:hypothetical protein